MLYFDTSFLVPLVVEQKASVDVSSYLARLDQESNMTSHWALVEFSSMLAREVRMGSVTPDDATDYQDTFDRLVRGSFRVAMVKDDDFRLATRFIHRFETGLKGPDAMHLAIAANRNVEQILSLDRKMVRAGGMLDLPIDTGIQLQGK